MGLGQYIALGGMMAANGRIGNPIPPGFVPIPEIIEIKDGTVLCWRVETNFKLAKPPDDLVQAFAELTDAEPDQILAFASRYGVLGLDENAELPKEPNLIAGIEPIEAW